MSIVEEPLYIESKPTSLGTQRKMERELDCLEQTFDKENFEKVAIEFRIRYAPATSHAKGSDVFLRLLRLGIRHQAPLEHVISGHFGQSNLSRFKGAMSEEDRQGLLSSCQAILSKPFFPGFTPSGIVIEAVAENFPELARDPTVRNALANSLKGFLSKVNRRGEAEMESYPHYFHLQKLFRLDPSLIENPLELALDFFRKASKHHLINTRHVGEILAEYPACGSHPEMYKIAKEALLSGIKNRTIDNQVDWLEGMGAVLRHVTGLSRDRELREFFHPRLITIAPHFSEEVDHEQARQGYERITKLVHEIGLSLGAGLDCTRATGPLDGSPLMSAFREKVRFAVATRTEQVLWGYSLSTDGFAPLNERGVLSRNNYENRVEQLKERLSEAALLEVLDEIADLFYSRSQFRYSPDDRRVGDAFDSQEPHGNCEARVLAMGMLIERVAQGIPDLEGIEVQVFKKHVRLIVIVKGEKFLLEGRSLKRWQPEEGTSVISFAEAIHLNVKYKKEDLMTAFNWEARTKDSHLYGRVPPATKEYPEGNEEAEEIFGNTRALSSRIDHRVAPSIRQGIANISRRVLLVGSLLMCVSSSTDHAPTHDESPQSTIKTELPFFDLAGGVLLAIGVSTFARRRPIVAQRDLGLGEARPSSSSKENGTVGQSGTEPKSAGTLSVSKSNPMRSSTTTMISVLRANAEGVQGLYEEPPASVLQPNQQRPMGLPLLLAAGAGAWLIYSHQENPSTGTMNMPAQANLLSPSINSTLENNLAEQSGVFDGTDFLLEQSSNAVSRCWWIELPPNVHYLDAKLLNDWLNDSSLERVHVQGEGLDLSELVHQPKTSSTSQTTMELTGYRGAQVTVTPEGTTVSGDTAPVPENLIRDDVNEARERWHGVMNGETPVASGVKVEPCATEETNGFHP